MPLIRTTPVKQRPTNRPVWSDRRGEHWASIQEAAMALGVRPNAVYGALRGFTPRCRGRVLYGAPPPWVLAETAEQERRRIAAIKVRVPPGGRVHMGNGYGPDGEWYGTGAGVSAEEKLKSAKNSGTGIPGPAVEWEAGRPDVGSTEATLTDKSA